MEIVLLQRNANKHLDGAKQAGNERVKHHDPCPFPRTVRSLGIVFDRTLASEFLVSPEKASWSQLPHCTEIKIDGYHRESGNETHTGISRTRLVARRSRNGLNRIKWEYFRGGGVYGIDNSLLLRSYSIYIPKRNNLVPAIINCGSHPRLKFSQDHRHLRLAYIASSQSRPTQYCPPIPVDISYSGYP